MSEEEKPKSDIEEVRQAESRRGKRPIDLEERKRKKSRLRDMEEHLRIETEQEFAAAMRACGLQEDSPKYRAALAIWRGEA
jgi:hypothetical protein